ncbi:MAG: PD-(D/E)XK nuclease family protein [Clostridia bacterium]|nr:PD-(D/E)XK nuclease family protein [Clostridia bacterium]
MFYRVIGPMGSGKESFMLDLAKNAFDARERVFFIVPEQATARYERALTEHLGNRCSLFAEVCNFSRLSNLVLRQYGSLAGRSVTEEEKKLLLARILKEKRGTLKHLPTRPSPDAIDRFYGELEEARQAGLSGESLAGLCRDEALSPTLREKLEELHLVQSRLAATLEGRFTDPAMEEERLCRILEEYPFFKDTTVLIDGFWDFTAPQEALIRRFFRQAKTVAISFVAEKGKTELFERSLLSARRCLRFAREAGVEVEDVTLTPKAEAGPLHFLQQGLGGGTEVWAEKPEGLTLTACTTPTDQAEAVCDSILALVQKGARWRDLAILSRNEGSQNVIKWVLEAQGIPVFCEEKKPLAQSPLARTLILGVQIATLRAREEAVREYLVRGLFSCPEEEKFLLEKYIATWSPSCRSLLDGKDFVMNPNGYFTIGKDEAAELEKVNRAKGKVFTPIRHLSMALAAGTNGEKAAALVAFLQEIGAEKELSQELRRGEEQELWEEAGEAVRTWNCVLERISGIARTCGDETDEAEDFASLLTMALSGSLPGQIPPGQDRVHLGQLGFARPENVTHLFLTDLNAGVFPAPPPKGQLISQEERIRLGEYGYPLSHGDRAQNDELFLLYLAAATPKEALHLSYLTGADSQGGHGALSVFGKRILALFPKLKEEIRSREDAMPRTKEAAFRYVLSHAGEDTPLMQALTAELEQDEAFRNRLLTCVSGKGLLREEFALTEELPYEGQDVSMTYSRLETYSKCRFSYFARYLLEAKAQGKARFGANVTGSFVHRVLEVVLARLAAEGKRLQELSRQELKAMNDLAFEEAVKEIALQGIEDPTVSMQLKQIGRSTLLILRNMQMEFADSAFEPLFFEKELTDLGGSYTLPLPDGTKLCLYGTIDRVDRYVGKNGREYVRVVDYKTGPQTFCLEDVANGLDLQMLLYLFALWGRPLSQNGGEGSLPAGILYMSGMGTSTACENEKELKKVEETPFLGLKRKGLMVDDAELLSAQDPAGDGKWIPVAWNHLTKSGKRALVTMEKLGMLRRKVEADFTRLAAELKGGLIQTNPIFSQSKQIDPCQYCDHLPICKRNASCRRPYRAKVTDEEIFGREEV